MYKSFFLALVTLFITAVGQANDCQYYGSIDALLWKPSHTPIVAGRQIGPDGGGQRPRENLLIKGDHEWGVRARIGYAACDYFLDLAYLYYEPPTEKASFTAAPGSVIRMPSGATTDNLQSLASHLDWKYQNLNGRIGYNFVNCDCYNLFVFGNARWVDFEFSNLDIGVRTTPAAQPDTFFQKSTFCGGGLGVGIGGRADLFCGFGVSGSVGTMAVIGRLKPQVSFFEEDVANSTLTLAEDSSTCIIPAVEFTLAIDYAFCLCGWRMDAAVGYELDYYYDIMKHNIGIERDGADDVPTLTYYNAGFGGPFIRLSVLF